MGEGRAYRLLGRGRGGRERGGYSGRLDVAYLVLLHCFLVLVVGGIDDSLPVTCLEATVESRLRDEPAGLWDVKSRSFGIFFRDIKYTYSLQILLLLTIASMDDHTSRQ
jgi:hypothetical protein